MQPFRGPPPPRGFPGAMQPPIAGMGAPSHSLMHPPSMVSGGMMPPRGVMVQVPPRGGPMMFPPRGMAPGFPSSVPFGAHGMAAGPPGVSNSAPPPPGTVDIPVPIVELPDTGPMNVFVGKLPPDLHDSYIRQLLEKCGTVMTWKRTADPVTGKPKGFGYCTFATSSDVLRALRLLNGFFVDSREILVKVDSKTQAKLDVVTKAMTEKMKIEEQERDDEIKRELMNLFEVRSGLMGGQQNDVATWGELLEKKTAAADTSNSSSKEQQDQQQNGLQNSVDRGGEKPEVPGAVSNQSGDSSMSRDAAPMQGERIRGKMIMSEIEKFRLAQEQREQEQEQKRREAVLERLRREKEDEERRKAADERRREADERRKAAEVKRKEAEEAAEKAREDAAAARAKRKEDNDEQSSTESDEENEDIVRSRKSSRSSRRQEKERDRDRKKRNTRERDHDRKRNRDHRSRSRSRSRERSRRYRSSSRKSRSRSRTRSRSRSRHRDRGRDRERRKRRHQRGSLDSDDRSDHDKDERQRSSKRRRDSTKDRRTGDEHDRDEEAKEKERDGIEVNKAESSSPPPITAIANVETPRAVVMPKVVLGLKIANATAKKEKPVTIPTVSAFAIEEEVVVKPSRELVPIDYTEEEKLAGASVQQRIAATVARINSRSEDVKSLIDQIPTATVELFAFPIDWLAVDQYKIVKDKMEPWVTKKIVEYLGENEPTLLEFLLKKLTQHARPIEILEELQLVLDSDAEVFVKLLWRKLAFEAVRARISS